VKTCPFHAHPRANIAKELFAAFRARGFAASCYFSKSDWHHPCYWMDVNAEAIHGTRAMAPFAEGPVRHTRRGRDRYAIVLAEADAERPPDTVHVSGPRPAAGTAVRLLGRREPLAWDAEGEGLRVRLPPGPLPCRHAWAIGLAGAAD
jgi:hypothetical protein